MRDELYGEIFAAEQEHWWFVARHRIVLHLLERYNGKIRNSSRGCASLARKLRCGFDARRPRTSEV